jgi:hypothetical protein
MTRSGPLSGVKAVIHHMANSVCHRPAVRRCSKSGCSPWWPQPGRGARTLSAARCRSGPSTAVAASASSRWSQHGANAASASSSFACTTPGSAMSGAGSAAQAATVWQTSSDRRPAILAVTVSSSSEGTIK